MKKLFVFADKTSDIYQTERDEYNKLTTDTITSTYKKIPDKMSNKVNADENINNRNKKAVNRIFLNGRNSCFIRLSERPQTKIFKQPHFVDGVGFIN